MRKLIVILKLLYLRNNLQHQMGIIFAIFLHQIHHKEKERKKGIEEGREGKAWHLS